MHQKTVSHLQTHLAKFPLQMFIADPPNTSYSMCFDNVNLKTKKNYQFKDHLNNQMNMVQSDASKDSIPPPDPSCKVPSADV